MLWVIGHVPGAGLLRDAQKFLAPLVLVVSAALGVVTDALIARVRDMHVRLSLALALVAIPVVLLPDAAPTTWRTVDPVAYPPGFSRVERVLDDAAPGALATLPWRSYRVFGWGHGVSSDPAVRWFPRQVVVNDDLVVGTTLIPGEDPVAAAISRGLRSGRPADVLARHGVRWVLVYRDDPTASRLRLDGFRRAYADRDMALLEVTGPVRDAAGPSTRRRTAVLAADVLAFAGLAGAMVLRVRRRRVRLR